MIGKIANALKEASGAGLLLASLAACSTAAQAASYTMYRDAGCGCCEKWAEHAEAGLNAAVKTEDAPDIQAVKDLHGVPMELRACHTMIVEGYVIEGHVPAEAIQKLLREKPDDIIGIAVPGMPVGSPGMEQQDMKQPYQVIAFGPKGQRIFAAYN
ncbi:MAG: DUF411 domain-containing protein [Parasphingorhabdus sp.]|uniref:DUF411 domain-containing protein n=1 Tax=Parasphingorhabdus sp. TaxID=2709688 RepID=UPI00300117CE